MLDATDTKPKHQFMIDQEEVGQRIKSLREGKKMTQNDLAKLIGKARASIAQWEGGGHSPSLSDIAAMAFYLNSSPTYIAFGISASHDQSYKVPVMDYATPDGSKVGEMALDMEFFKSLHRTQKAVIRAMHLPRGDMMDNMPKGSVIIIDESDKTLDGVGEAVLIHHKVPAVAYVNAVPGKENTYQVRVGGQFFQIEGNLPVIGKIVATIKPAV